VPLALRLSEKTTRTLAAPVTLRLVLRVVTQAGIMMLHRVMFNLKLLYYSKHKGSVETTKRLATGKYSDNYTGLFS